ncbi:SagB/ThcOx family dehydrogenase [Desulfosediminicola sp.]|uniref:SagB/ThcOx family dehydrogenase n=1 Tax=Desulfosediminicola sp. TaxID=2886825 RepID=UPI003AF2F868
MASGDMVSMQFMQKSSISRNGLKAERSPMLKAAPPFKTYPDAQRFKLPEKSSGFTPQEPDLNKLLKKRRSGRVYSKAPIAFDSLAHIVWAGQGVTAAAGDRLFRTAPSAGALYPIETYLSVQNVDTLSPGLYHLDVTNLALEYIQEGHLGSQITRACLDQTFLSQAAVIFIWTAVFMRTLPRYGDRGLRFIFMESAHICQNILLAAEANDCWGCPVAAFFDAEMNDILKIDGVHEATIYVAAIGKR